MGVAGEVTRSLFFAAQNGRAELMQRGGGRDTSRRVLPNTIIPPSPISFPRRVGLGEQGVVVCLPRPLPLPGHVPPASQWGSGGVGEEALGLGGEGKNLVLQLQRLPDLRSSHHPTPYRGVNTP